MAGLAVAHCAVVEYSVRPNPLPSSQQGQRDRRQRRRPPALLFSSPNPNPSLPWNRPPPPSRPIRRPRSTPRLPPAPSPPPGSTPPPTASSSPASWTPTTGPRYRRRPRPLPSLPTPTLRPSPHRSDLFFPALYPSIAYSTHRDFSIGRREFIYFSEAPRSPQAIPPRRCCRWGPLTEGPS
jgi:hypothetical protein